MKEVDIQTNEDESQDEKGSDSKILNLKIENSYKELKQEKIREEDNNPKSCNVFFFLNKLFIIRAMLLMVFLIFCYFLIKLIQKGAIIYKTQYSHIYLQKQLTNSQLKELQSHQLINEKNIEIIEELNISLNIEYSKYVHLRITDYFKNRWEIPKDVLNDEYFKNLNSSNNTSNFKVEYSQTNENFYFNLYFDSPNVDGKIEKNTFYKFNASNNFLFSNNYINFESHLTTDDIYGFGERVHNFKLKEGIYTIWAIDRKNYYDDGTGGKNIYGHQPIGLHKTKYNDIWLGFVFLNTNPQDIQISKKDDGAILSHKTIGGIIDYYIIVDNSPENVLRDIHYLIGVPILPPYWSLGNHQCRWGYKHGDEFKIVYENYKLKKIPIDTMWLDLESYNKFQVFTINEKFKEVPEFLDNIIHKDHGYLVPNINIGISYNKTYPNEYAKIGDEYNLFIKSGYTKDNIYARIWPIGRTVFPDFFNPDVDKLWYKGLDDYHDIIKYDGIWLDRNEPSNFKRTYCPGEVFENINEEYKCDIIKDFKISYLPGYTDNLNVLTNRTLNMNGFTYGNNILYNNKPLLSVYQSKLSYNYLKNKNQRPFVLSRSNCFGTGKYSFHWLGDNFSENKYIEYSISGIFNYNIFGIPFTGADICGFTGDSNGNLCTRWYNIGAFYPFSRNHNSRKAIDQNPWSFGKATEKIIKKDIKYRYSLIRYFYSQLFLISLNEKGSFFKPVMFEYPNDIYSYEDIESKIMIGEAFLICAFFDNEENDKNFVLPNSHFNIYPFGENVLNYYSEDNINLRRKTLSGKLSELHLFLRGGYIIPMQNTFTKYILNTYYLRQEKLNIIINPDHEGYSKGVIFYDNDENDVIENNKYIRVNLEFKNKTLTIKTNDISSLEYQYKDNILNKIEIWRINEILKVNEIKTININLKVKIKNNEQNIKGILSKKMNKLVIEFDNISIFDLNEVNLNIIRY